MTQVNLVEHDIVLPNLPESYDGLRVIHLSDLHVGPLLPIDRAIATLERTNAMDGDIIAITGDFIDLSLDVLDELLPALAKLHAPLGVYMVPGNHDYLDDANQFIQRFRDANLNLLVNQTIELDHHDHRIQIAGIDFAKRRRDLKNHLRSALHDTHRQPDFRLLLSHHPDAFEAALQQHVDLTLAGHTHGGQLNLSNRRGRKGSIGLGSLAFRYPQGLYTRGDQHLFVTAGVGSWFPLRMKCSAEIARLTLRHHAPDIERSHP